MRQAHATGQDTTRSPKISDMNSFGYVFPAIRGVQAGKEYYVSMCPLRLIPRIFLFDEEELVPEIRAQRALNKNRVPEIARYILKNQGDYVFSALTASVDAEVQFEAAGTGQESTRIGLLRIPMAAKFIINDGQHRRAAIEVALKERPELGNESIAVVFFLDIGLERSQQMFADLNRYAIRPSKSIGVLYDHRDDLAKIAKLVVLKSKVFRNVVEMERSTLSIRSRKLFTLSSIYTATSALLRNSPDGPVEERSQQALLFWEEVAEQFPEWRLVIDNKMTAGEVRRDFIHSHGIVLQALGKIGNVLLRGNSTGWKAKIKRLKTINWSRSNSADWEGRAMIGGRVSKAEQNVVLAGNLIKQRLGLTLTPEEKRVEDAHRRGEYGESAKAASVGV
jgi:DNA sulfur modification protein DndB